MVGETILLPSSGTQCALVVAHPGHEVRVHGWLESTQPRVCILTDGSGNTGRSRLHSTTILLAECGAQRGPIYGHLTDLAVYQAILNQDCDLFIKLACELADTFVCAQVECVVGDAIEGYNSVHDVCRLIIDAAVELSKRASRRQIANFDFPVVGRPDACPEDLRSNALWLHLDRDAFARKLQAARTYYPELLDEVANTVNGTDRGVYRAYLDYVAEADPSVECLELDSFRVECLRPVEHRKWKTIFSERPPFFEYHGERQVAAGRYQQVIRFSEHLKPLAEGLCNYVGVNA